MTEKETLAIMSVLKAAYPNFYRDMQRTEAQGIVNLWTEMFRDESAEVVAMAVKAFIANDATGFPPHIGAIKNAIVKLHTHDEMTELEAWELVRKATRNANYGAKEEFDKLPPVVQRLVGSPNQLREWAMMDSDVLGSVVASNFQRSYRARMENEREYLTLPSDVRNTMARLSDSMKMPALSDGVSNAKRNEQLQKLLGSVGM